MTIYPLRVGKTYRTRDGSAEHTISRIETGYTRHGDIAWGGIDNAWWANTGKSYGDLERPSDLVEEVHPTAPTAEGPVRRRTVTTTEIRPGVYNRLWVKYPDGTWMGRPLLCAIVEHDEPNPDRPPFLAAMNAEELDALAAIATQLADALRAIKTEKAQ